MANLAAKKPKPKSKVNPGLAKTLDHYLTEDGVDVDLLIKDEARDMIVAFVKNDRLEVEEVERILDAAEASVEKDDTVEADEQPAPWIVPQDLLNVTTAKIQKIDAKAKEYKEAREDERDLFFVLATRVAAKGLLQRKSEQIIADSEERLTVVLADRFPEWIVLEKGAAKDDNGELIEGAFDVLLEEDPKFAKYVYVNPEINYEFKRGLTMRGAGFDVESFVKEQPELALRTCTQTVTISALPMTGKVAQAFMESTIEELIAEDDPMVTDRLSVSHVLDEEKAEAFIAEYPEHMETFAKYRTAGTPTPSLAAPKKLAKKKAKK